MPYTSDSVIAILDAAGIPISHDQRSALEEFVRRLLEWNVKINLISRKDVQEVWRNHVLHALSVLAVAPPPPQARYLDIGTGGGLPGIPLAIMLPRATFTLADSIGKKIGAVEDMARALGLSNVRTMNTRVETMHDGSMHAGRFDVCLARAVTRLADLARWSAPLLRGGRDGLLIAWKGGGLAEELRETRGLRGVREVVQRPIALPGEDSFIREDKHIVTVRFDV